MDMKKFNAVLLILLAILSGCNLNNRRPENQHPQNEVKGDLIIFHAGSLSVPFKEISEAFNKLYPDVKIIREAAGSRKCARKITDLKRDCDIMASADYTVIDQLLIPEYADWNIKFASNEMTIVFTKDSEYAAEINADNWTDILMRDNVAYGRSDPNADPCGYRAVLTIELAEKYYNKPGLAGAFLAKDKKYIRPKETDLLALLESHNIDYIFLYRSVAEQHGLKYLILPDEINLKNPQFGDLYHSVTVDISGKKPGEVITKTGEPMVYGITIIKNAPNKEAAMKFLGFLLDADKGMEIMKRNGQPSVIPMPTGSYDKIPGQLKKFALPR
jgi:molybdate/tungstate transport system substrate-binding protein